MPINSERLQDGREKLKGVGGWLMIFILTLTFVAPLFQLRIVARSFETLLSSKPLTQGGILRLSVMVAVYAGLALFSCISGIMLWSGHRRAPEVTKTYLIVSLLAVGILYSSYRLVGLDLHLSRVLLNRAIYSCFWYAYLVRSRRVRLTYATDHGVTPMPSPSSPEAASP
jgi:hypothetical protein